MPSSWPERVLSSYRTPTPGSSVSSSSTRGSSQNVVRAAGRPAAPPGAARGGRPAGRAGCGRRTRRPARRRPRPASRTAGSSCCSGDRHRHVVVAALDAEVAGQPAAAAEPGDAGAGPRAAARRRPTSPSPRGGGSAAGRRPPARPGPAAPSPGWRRAARPGCGCRRRPRSAAGAADQLERLAAQHGGAGRLHARRSATPASTSGASASTVCREDRAGRRRAGRW